MSDTVNQAGKWLGLGWEKATSSPLEVDSLLNNALNAGSGLPGLFERGVYGFTEKSGKDWEAASEIVKEEERVKKAEEAAARQQILDIINRPAPEQPTFEWPEYEMPQIPQWTPPPTQVATPPATADKKTYQPRRTPTVLTKPGDVAAGGKGKKKLLGE